MQTRHRAIPAAGILWLVVIAWCTLRPLSGIRLERHIPVDWTCILCGNAGVTDLVLNLVLFLPLGFVAWGLGWSMRRVVCTALVFTIAIECSQAFLLPGRDASLGDVLSNSCGALAGWFLARSGQAVIRSRKQRVTAAILCTGLHAIIWFGTAFMLQPAMDHTQPWRARRYISNGFSPAATSAAWLNQIPLDSTAFRILPAGLLASEVSIDLTIRPASMPGRQSFLMRVRDSSALTVLDVDQNRSEVSLWLRTRASAYSWRNPGWSFPTGDALTPGKAARLTFRWNQRTVQLSITALNDSTTLQMTERRSSIGLGWVLIHPFVGDIGENAVAWSWLWIAWWFGVLGWLAGGVSRRFVLAAGLGCVGLFAAAALAARWPATAPEVAVMILSLSIGAAASRWPQTQKRDE